MLRISQRNEPATLDPQLATLPDEFFVIRALGEGLLIPAPGGGNPLPATAESWTVTPDGRTYTFQLRADARWSTGDPVTPDDFVYSVRRVLSPALAAPKAALFFPLKNARAYFSGRETDFTAVGVRALDGRRVEYTLEEPATDFPALVASGPWIPVPRATIEKFGRSDQRGSAWMRPENLVGNGPFRLAAWRPNQEIVLRPSATYRDAARVHLAEIRLLAFDNGDSEERAFRAGQIDLTMSVPFTKLASYRDAAAGVLHQIPLHETRYLALNTHRAPLDNPAVRRALALAINRPQLVQKVLQGGQQPAFSFIPPGLGGYQPGRQIAEDANEARRLLREAGYPDGQGFPKLELTSWPVGTAQLEAIQQMWRKELGIEVTLAPHEARTYLAELAAGNFAIAFATAIPDYDGASALFSDLTSGHAGNYPQWSNPEFDRLVFEAGRTGSPERRVAAYQQAEAILTDEMPLIPLYFNTQNFLQQPRVRHWETDRLWTRFYGSVEVE